MLSTLSLAAPGIVPLALASALCPLLLAQNIFSSWLSFGHCHLPRSLSLPYLETLLCRSPDSAFPGQGTHLIIGMIFGTPERNNSPSPCMRGMLLCPRVLNVCALGLLH